MPTNISSATLLAPSAADNLLPPPTRLRTHKAAQEFEALLIGQMMKTVRESGSEDWLGSGDGTGDDTAIEMAESQFAQAMSSNGGLGLSRVIEQDVSRQQANQNE